MNGKTDMKIKSLDLRTEFLCHMPDSNFADRGEYLVIGTPSNPTFWCGNCLLFKNPPQAGDYKRWMAIFLEELKIPEDRHRVFYIDSPDGDSGCTQEFLANGFEVETHDVLSLDANGFRPCDSALPELSFRTVNTDPEWAALVTMSCLTACADKAQGTGPGYEDYLRLRMDSYRAKSRRGEGAWWAAFLDDKPVADMGLYFAEGLGRFCAVETHPDYRRKGICRTLLSTVCADAFAAGRAETLVIMPEDGPVRRIYESVGFAFRERSVCIMRAPAAGGS